MKKTYLFFILTLLLVDLYSQDISIGTSFGYSLAHGDWFHRSGAGFNIQADAMYHINQFNQISDNNRLAIGLDWDHSFVAGGNKADDGLTYGRSAIGILGIKFYYEFKSKFYNENLTPFLSITPGLSYFSSGNLNSGDIVLLESTTKYNMGVKLQVGTYIYNKISVSLSWNVIRDRELYFDTLGTKKYGAGAFILSLGYRFNITQLIGKTQKIF